MYQNTHIDEFTKQVYRDLQTIEALHRELLEELRLLSLRARPLVIPDWDK